MFMFNVYVYNYVTTGLYFSLLPRNLVSPPQNVPISGVCLYFTLNKKMCNICSIWQMFCLLLSPSVWCFVASIKESWNLVLHIFVHTVSSSFVDLVLQLELHTRTWYFRLELGYLTLSSTLLVHPSWTPRAQLRLFPHKQISPKYNCCTFRFFLKICFRPRPIKIRKWIVKIVCMVKASSCAFK